ncbi:MAG: leucine--tRNA ligase [Candidatus Aenigmarchaeota archaeon]|nr:leucine--tRNA ligase [Candidatus Aenigmarchaeota archaeon]
MSSQPDFHSIEKRWQQKWEKDRVFEADRDESKEKKLMAIPYPYCSGPLHIGHGRTYTIADVWIRHMRMRGYNALWPMAFHITGTPILAVSRRIAEKDWKTIELYKDYVRLYVKDEKKINETVKSFSEPENVADFFSKVISSDFKSLGFSIDWRRSFTTGDKDYNKFIEWQFHLLKEKGLIKKGRHPVQYCLNCQNAVGEDDIKDGDTLDTGINALVAVKFPFEDGYLIAASLRPETIFGVTNIWVRKGARYVRTESKGEIWYLSENAFAKLEYQGHSIKKAKTIDSSFFEGKEAGVPAEDRKIPILAADFIDMEFGTGIVYSVPAHSPDDYIALMEANKALKKKIVIIDVIGFGPEEKSRINVKSITEKLGIKSQDEKEKLNQANAELYRHEFYHGILNGKNRQFSGMAVAKAKIEVKGWLESQSKAFDFFESATLSLECRDGGKVVVKVIEDQWFIDYGNKEWKNLAKKCLTEMKIIPEKYRASFLHTIDWLEERACARRRGLGTKLPWDMEWIIESLSDSTIYPAFYMLAHHIRNNKIKEESLTKEFFDFVLLKKGRSEGVSKSTGIKKEALETIQSDFDYWYPVDLRHTAIPHVTNHLTFYIFNHAAIFPMDKWPKAITLNELLVREGNKMSKSKGNVIPLVDISRQYSADLYRLYITSSADMDTVIDWQERNVETVKRKLSRFYEIAKIIASGKTKGIGGNADLWLASRFNSRLKEASGHIEDFRMRDYIQLMLFETLNDFSHYLKRADEPNYGMLRALAEDWIKSLSPVIPHLCEELWSLYGRRNYISLEPFPRHNESLINASAEQLEEYLRQSLEDMRQIVKITGRQPRSVHIYVSPLWKYTVYSEVLEGSKKENVLQALMKNPDIRKHGNHAVLYVQHLMKSQGSLNPIEAGQNEEFSILDEAKAFLRRELSLDSKAEIRIWKADDASAYDPKSKAQKASPFKPAIYVE